MKIILSFELNSPLCPLKGKFAPLELAILFEAITPLRGLGVSNLIHNLN